MKRYLPLLLIILSSHLIADSWSQFRHDPAHTGFSDEFQPLLFLRWRFQTGNTVWSSPAISGDTLFIGSSDSTIYALNATTSNPNGELIWSYKTGGMVRSSPAVAYGFVYVTSFDGYLYCLKQFPSNPPQGEVVWRYYLGSFTTFTSSPAVADTKVFVGSEVGYLYCLKAITSNPNGELVWKYFTGKWIHGSPAVAYNRVFIGNSGDSTGGYYMFCLDENSPDTNGVLLWQYYVGNRRNGIRTSPAVKDSLVFFATDNLTGQYNQASFYALKVFPSNPPNGELYWSFTGFEGMMSSAAIANDRVFVGMEGDGLIPRSLVCFRERPTNPPNAETIWTYPLPATYRSSPAIASSKGYIGTENGTFYCFRASASRPEILWTYWAGEPIFSSPAIKSGMAFVGSGINGSTGAVYGFGTPIIFDVGIDSFPLPDTIEPGPIETIQVWVKNYSSIVLDVPVAFSLYDVTTDTILIGTDTLVASGLPPNQRIRVDFPSFYAVDTGIYLFECSTVLQDQNPSNDCRRKIVVCRILQGIVDGTNRIEFSERIKATVMTTAQFKSQLAKLPSKLKIYTPTGQKVDPARISRGICFLKLESKILKIVIIK
jgi:outer membrane protein assembly factor BamB